MGILKKASFLALSCGFLFASVDELDKLDISAKSKFDEYKKGTSTSSINDVKDSTEQLDSIIRKTPGAYTNIDKRNGGLSVNIRNQTGFGRVNTIVDGVNSTYFGQSSDDGGGFHTGAEGFSSSYSSLVDANFIADMSVEKGYASGRGGVNSLMGSASVRTIDVDDVVFSGNDFGILSKYSYTSNKVGPSFMITFAKKASEKGVNLGMLVGYSEHQIRQDYKYGGGKNISDVAVPDENDNGDMEQMKNPVLGDMKALKQKPQSVLAKISLDDELKHTKFTYKNYKNTLSRRDITQDEIILNHSYTPDNDYLSPSLMIAYVKNSQNYHSDAITGGNPFAGEYGLAQNNYSLQFDLNNTSIFDLNDTNSLNFVYGLNYLSNKYDKQYNQKKFKEDMGNNADDMINSIPLTPNSKQKLYSLYLNAEFDSNYFNVVTNLNYSKAKLEGFKPECSKSFTCFPKKATNIDKDFSLFNPSLAISFKPYEIFMPFVSISYTSRMPNATEMFFSNDSGESINPFLKKEKALTSQVGINGFANDMILDNDEFGYKVVAYKTKIKDYIYNKKFELDEFGNSATLYLNYDKDVTIKGLELSTSYDSKYFFANLNYSRQNTNQPTSDTFASSEFNFANDRISIMPKDYANLELGTHLWNLDMSITAKYTGKAYKIDSTGMKESGDEFDNNSPFAKIEIPSVLTYDFSSKYTINKNFYIKFDIYNLFDKKYIDALDSLNQSVSQVGYNPNTDETFDISNNFARGRMFAIMFNARF